MGLISDSYTSFRVAVPYGRTILVQRSTVIRHNTIRHAVREFKFATYCGCNARAPHTSGESTPAQVTPRAQLAQTQNDPRSKDRVKYTLRSIPAMSVHRLVLV